MSIRSIALPALAALLLVAGCAQRNAPDGSQDGASSSWQPLRTERGAGGTTGYPFRPAPFYNLDDLDELSGPLGYTGGY